MSQPDSDEAQITFHDASVYFSKDEWNLLQEWQKELYRNVMKEIHQALISLGPIIATTVCSLRAKETEEMCPMDSQDSERKHRITPCTGDTVAEPELFKINDKDSQNMELPQDYELQGRNDCLSTGFSFLNTDNCLKEEPETDSILIDDLGAEIGEHSTNPTMGNEVVSFLINDEDEISGDDPQDSREIKCTRSPSGDNDMNKHKEVVESIKRSKPKMHCESSALKTISKGFQNTTNGASCKSQMLSETYQRRRREGTARFHNASFKTQHYFLSRATAKVGPSQNYNAFQSGVGNPQVLSGSQTTQQNQTLYTCSKCYKSYTFKEDLVRHMAMHSKVRPYGCTYCGKCFLQKGSLINHYRTHTGEKPFMCSFCQKCFSRKDYLEAHIRTHTGERPYKCTECEKSFTQKGDLNQHRRKHT